MKLDETAHTTQPWRIHEIAPDFRLEDVWALPTPGGPDDFPQLVELMEAFDPAKATPAAVRALFALRWRLGELFGWDRPKAGLGSRVPTLRDRLPADLRATTAAADAAEPHFRGLYRTESEWALEIANQTVHGILHVGWVPNGTRWLPRADGGPGEAERPLRAGLHGRDHAVSLPARVPRDAARARAGVAGRLTQQACAWA